MAREKDANPRFARRIDNLKDFVRDLRTIRDLLHDSDLHVVYDESQSRGITNVLQRLRNIQFECALHNAYHLAR